MRGIIFGILLSSFFASNIQAAIADQIGFTVLQVFTTNLNGAGILLAQPEAEVADPPPTWQVNPGAVGQPVTFFTFSSDLGTSTNFPNALGNDSWHADDVALIIYGKPGGLATNLAHVDNLDANFYFSNYVGNDALPNLGDAIVNQSFTFGAETNQVSVAEQQELDSQYDNYAVQNNTLFVSAANNGGSVSPPGTAYNCISVGAYGVASGSSYGPTLDNGRCKPDITAPAQYTSFSTPYISGAAALLMQAAARGDGGADTVSAGDMRTIKALLLNGAVKPADWTNAPTYPLDIRYGAGLVNVFNAYKQLAGGKHAYSSSTTVAMGAGHATGGFSNPVAVLSGWDFNTNSSSEVQDAINHYYFEVTNGSPGTIFTATATLVWNRGYNADYIINPADINNLDLYLYDVSNSNLVMASLSPSNNVEHIYVPQLPAGRYDLQVWKAGGSAMVSPSETYALAFDFFSTSLAVTNSGGQMVLSWPVYPDGFGVVASSNLLAGQWSQSNLPPVIISGGMNTVTLAATNAAQFFRLQRPDF
jgi:hypothetical protein